MIELKKIVVDLKSEFAKEFGDSKPFVKNSFLSILLNTFAFGIYQLRLKMDYLLKQVFANTANREHLKLQAQNRIEDLQPKSSTGLVVLNGVAGSTILAGEEFQINNLKFKTLADCIINTITLDNMESLIFKDKYVVLKFNSYHNLIGDMDLVITNATNAILNGTFKIAILDHYSIRFEIDKAGEFNEDVRKDSKVVLITTTLINVEVEALVTGTASNLNSYTKLDSTNANILHVGVNYNGLSGGRGSETDEEYRERFLKFLREPHAFFNKQYVKQLILEEFPKVTRCYINAPYTNLVNIYLVDDNVTDKLIKTAYMTTISTRLEEIRPINLNLGNFLITNANHQNLDLVITNFKPNVKSFKDLVKHDIDKYFAGLKVGEDINLNTLQGFIYNIRDFKNDYNVESFNLNIVDNVAVANTSIVSAKIEIQ